MGAVYGRDSGSGIPCRSIEDAAKIRLIDGAGEKDIYPGNMVNHDSHGGCFKDWSYTTEVVDGSYTIVHTGYDNVYDKAPFTTHAKTYRAAEKDELDSLRKRVAELEAQLA